MIVMKFGGSSVASATAIEWVAGIVKARVEQRPVVVVSAMGKPPTGWKKRRSRPWARPCD